MRLVADYHDGRDHDVAENCGVDVLSSTVEDIEDVSDLRVNFFVECVRIAVLHIGFNHFV